MNVKGPSKDKTKAAAGAAKPWIETQYVATGTGEFLFNRRASEDYEHAKKVLGDGISMVS